jgi:uncharacterized GH25 family protein
MTLAGFAAAHDLYLMPAHFRVSVGDKVVVSVHNGDSFPNSEGTTDPRRLLDARLSDGTAFEDFQMLGKATHGVVPVRSRGSLWASVHTEPRLLDPVPAEKFAAYLKEEGLPEVPYGREMYSKFAKALLVSEAPDASFRTPLGMTIEFVPEVNPGLLKPGDSLPVQVLFRGKPLPGVQVEKAWSASGATRGGQYQVVGRTDGEGRIAVPVQCAGKWRLHAVTMEKHPDARVADYASFWASLTFEVPETTRR